jgi:hypothetical protein
MLHPGWSPDEYNLPTPPPDESYDKDSKVQWEQNWAVCEVHDKAELELGVWKPPPTAEEETGTKECIDLKRRKTEVHCHENNKWCRPIVMFQVDHIRDVNYFFKTEVAYDLYTSEKYTEDMSVPYKVTIETMNAEYTSFEMVSFSGSVCPMILRIISSSSVQTLFDRHSRRDSSTSSS